MNSKNKRKLIYILIIICLVFVICKFFYSNKLYSSLYQNNKSDINLQDGDCVFLIEKLNYNADTYDDVFNYLIFKSDGNVYLLNVTDTQDYRNDYLHLNGSLDIDDFDNFICLGNISQNDLTRLNNNIKNLKYLNKNIDFEPYFYLQDRSIYSSLEYPDLNIINEELEDKIFEFQGLDDYFSTYFSEEILNRINSNSLDNSDFECFQIYTICDNDINYILFYQNPLTLFFDKEDTAINIIDFVCTSEYWKEFINITFYNKE